MKTIEVFATDGSGAIGNRVTYSFNWDPATQLVFAANGEPPATALPGANFASPVPVVVDAEDEFGNIATTYNGPVTISLANGATGLAGGTVTLNAVAGVATFPTLSIGTDGTYNLLGSSIGLTTTMPPSTPIVIVGAAANLFIIQQPPSPVQAGAPFSFEVGADDTFGNPTTIFPANATMTVAIGSNPGGSNPSGVAETVPVFDGMADFSGLTLNKVGTGYTLKVSSGSLTPVTTNPINVTNAPADHLTITTTGEPPATLLAGQTFGMVVTALDPFGNVDTGFSGQVTVAITGGVLTGNTTINVANGLAAFAGLAIDTTGKFQIQATSTPALTSALSTSVTVTPAAASKLVWASEPPSSVIHNYPFGAALNLEDQYGNLETNLTETVSIALDNDPNGANLGGTAFADLLGGVAAFSTLSIDSVGNGYTLQATAGTIMSLPSTPIDVTPTPAVSLEITVEPPTSVTVNQTFSVQVTALDQFNNPDGDFNGNVSVALASGPTLQLGGTLTETASNGIATFSDLAVGTVGGGYTLSVSSPSLVGATSSQFIVNPGAAAKLIVTSEPPSSVNAGAPFGFVITAVDQYGNLATSFNGIDSIGLGGTHPTGSSISGANSATGDERNRHRLRPGPHPVRQLYAPGFKHRAHARHDHRRHREGARCFPVRRLHPAAVDRHRRHSLRPRDHRRRQVRQSGVHVQQHGLGLALTQPRYGHPRWNADGPGLRRRGPVLRAPPRYGGSRLHDRGDQRQLQLATVVADHRDTRNSRQADCLHSPAHVHDFRLPVRPGDRSARSVRQPRNRLHRQCDDQAR